MKYLVKKYTKMTYLDNDCMLSNTKTLLSELEGISMELEVGDIIEKENNIIKHNSENINKEFIIEFEDMSYYVDNGYMEQV